jgi:hypothetical protein
MYYLDIRDRSAEDFKRLTGVLPETFQAMLRAVQRSASKFGRPPTLSDADQLLLTLLYWREYRTQYHVAAEYGISESTCGRIIRHVEEVLSESTHFKLPKKKRLDRSSIDIEVVVVDVTETPIERPKKSSASTTPARRSVIR